MIDRLLTDPILFAVVFCIGVPFTLAALAGVLAFSEASADANAEDNDGR